VGYIFAIYSVAVIFGSPLVGNMMKKFGRRNPIQFGMLLMGSAFITFGLMELIENTKIFLAFALLNRLCQGFASSLI